MQVICNDDSKRPKQVPEHKWLKKDKLYTVIDIVKLNIQVGAVGYKLEEIELDQSCFPYEYFNSNRFSLFEKVKEAVEYKEVDLSLI
jgi:hypothetical protein